MGYHNTRICFRLTARDAAKYKALWGKVFECYTWTDLIRRALDHFYAYHGSPEPKPTELSDGSLWDFSLRRHTTPPQIAEPLLPKHVSDSLGIEEIPVGSSPAAAVPTARPRTSTSSTARPRTSTKKGRKK